MSRCHYRFCPPAYFARPRRAVLCVCVCVCVCARRARACTYMDREREREREGETEGEREERRERGERARGRGGNRVTTAISAGEGRRGPVFPYVYCVPPNLAAPPRLSVT